MLTGILFKRESSKGRAIMTHQCKVNPEDLDHNYYMKIGRKRKYIVFEQYSYIIGISNSNKETGLKIQKQ